MNSFLVSLTRLVDKYFGSLLIILLKLFKWKRPIKGSGRTLFIKLWAMGESVLTLPLIREFADRNPASRITVLCTKRNKAVYEGHDFIHEVILFRPGNLFQLFLNFKKYNLCFDMEPYFKMSSLLSFWLSKRTIGFSHGLRSLLYDWRVKYDDKTHAVLTFINLLKPFGYVLKKPESLVQLHYSKEDENKVKKLLKSINTKGKILIGITAGSAETSLYRRWAPERFAKVADKLIEKHNCVVVFTDKEEEKDYIDQIIGMMEHGAFNFAGKTTLQQLFCLIEKCDVYISNDTGPMHVAAAQGVNTIGLFGPNTPVRYAPYGKENISIYKCDHEPYINPHKGKFKKPHHFCMNKITIGDLLRAVEKLIQE